jgi:hypothetical protein
MSRVFQPMSFIRRGLRSRFSSSPELMLGSIREGLIPEGLRITVKKLFNF